jgi:hypothetical protein
VPVLVLPDRDLPLVTALVSFRGGYGLFPRSRYAAGTALPALLRYGGVTGMAPDSVDIELETYAIQLSFGSGGGSISSSMNVLSEHFERSMDLWGRMLMDPGFDADEVDIWRGRELESVLRRPDDPGSVAFSEFNRLLYGDHPIGWEMNDRRPRRGCLHRRRAARVARAHRVPGEPARRAHRRSRVGGDPRYGRGLRPARTCLHGVAPRGTDPGRSAHSGECTSSTRSSTSRSSSWRTPTDLALSDDPEYYAATLGNAILGGGGFSSRIMDRVRTERGYAYSASSLWTTPTRYPGPDRRHHANAPRDGCRCRRGDPRDDARARFGTPDDRGGLDDHRPDRERIRLQLRERRSNRFTDDVLSRAGAAGRLARAVPGRRPGGRPGRRRERVRRASAAGRHDDPDRRRRRADRTWSGSAGWARSRCCRRPERRGGDRSGHGCVPSGRWPRQAAPQWIAAIPPVTSR